MVSESDKKWCEFQEYLAKEIAAIFDISPYFLGMYDTAVSQTFSLVKLPDITVESVGKIHDEFAGFLRKKGIPENMVLAAELSEIDEDELSYWEQSFGAKWGEENAE